MVSEMGSDGEDEVVIKVDHLRGDSSSSGSAVPISGSSDEVASCSGSVHSTAADGKLIARATYGLQRCRQLLLKRSHLLPR